MQLHTSSIPQTDVSGYLGLHISIGDMIRAFRMLVSRSLAHNMIEFEVSCSDLGLDQLAKEAKR